MKAITLQRMLVAAASTGAMAICSIATAQTGTAPQPTDDGAIAEIIVTAQRRSENLQNVPVAVTAVTGDALADAGISSTADLGAVVPGLNFTTSVGTYGLPGIRGVSTASQGPGVENPVATYIDGVYIVSSGGTLTGLHDVEQVAVLKGPQGTLFGRNATGGLVQITTRKPGSRPAFNLEGTYGNHEYSAINLYAAGPLGEKVAASIAASSENFAGGFGNNILTGTRIGTYKTKAIRGKLLFEPTTQTEITLSADYSKISSVTPAFRVIDVNVVAGPGAPAAPMAGGRRDIAVPFDPASRSEVGGGSLSIRHEFGGVQLVNLAAYRKYDLRAFLDGVVAQVFVPFAPNIVELNESGYQLSNELQLLSTTDGPLSWIAGAYVLRTVGRFDPSRVNIFPLGDVIRHVEQDLNSYSAFAQATYHFSESTNLTLGARYTIDRRKYDATQDGPRPGQFAEGHVSRTFKAPTFRVSLDHRFSRELMGYASYNRGFKSGTFVAQNVSPTTPIEPEYLDAFEVGVKADMFDRKLRFNLASFYYLYRDRQYKFVNMGQEFLYNAEKSRMYGLDADLTWKVTNEFTLNAGLSLIDAKYTRFTNSPITTPADPAVGGNIISFGSVNGKNIESTPPWTLNIGPSYRLPTGIGEFNFNVNYYHNGGWYANPDNRVKQPAYDVVNANMAFEPSGLQGVKVNIWGKNIFDEYYASQYNSQLYGNTLNPAPGRTFGVTVGYSY